MSFASPTTRTARPFAALLCIVTLAACAGSDPDQQLLDIRRWEDTRTLAADSLTALVHSAPPDVRAAAARALGHIGDPRATPALVDALEKDVRTEVRAEAAFALGLLGVPEGAPPLVRALSHETEPLAIGEIALALGRLLQPGSAGELVPLLSQPHPHVREQAIEALALLADSTAVPALLVATHDPLESVAWRAVYALEKVPSPAALPRLYELAASPSPVLRASVARTLGRIGDRSATATVSQLLARGADAWRVRVNAALALGRLGGEDALRAVAPALSDSVFHVRDAALQAIATAALAAAARPATPPPTGYAPLELAAARELLPAVASACSDPVVDVRASAYAALAALEGARAFERLQAGTADPSAHVAAVCAEQLAIAGPARAQAPLAALLTDAERPRLQVAAASALGHLGDLAAAAPLRPRVFDRDWVMAATSIEALGNLGDHACVPDLARAFRERKGPGRADVRWQVVQTLAALADTGAVPLLRQALTDDDARVRLAARDALAHLLPELDAATLSTADALRRDIRPARRSPEQPPLVARSHARQLELSTDRGRIVIDLLGEQAPQTVESFARLAARGFFDGLTFHRVVPNFVVQGGDPLGSGWGDAGYTLRCEYSPLRYERGVVGVAHSGKDTGGCQLFITQSDQPHLNARYTIFGRVVEGLDVVDRIQIGDHFRARVVWEDAAR